MNNAPSHITFGQKLLAVVLLGIAAVVSVCVLLTFRSDRPTDSSPPSSPPVTVEETPAPVTLTASNATEVVATLDAPIPEGKNGVWCASFLAAWKTLAEDVAQEPLVLEGPEEPATSLNNARDPRPDIPETALYTKAGWANQGVIDQIRKEVTAKFPSKEAPSFPGAATNSFIAYSYIEANVKFSIPYFQNREPLEFKDSAGRKTPILSFGIREEDEYAFWKLRSQPKLLFREGDGYREDMEFAMDLCGDSEPSQIVVALIKREPTIAAALARVEQGRTEMAKLNQQERNYRLRIGPNDILLIPDIFQKLSHRFSELEGRTFKNPKLKGQKIDIAQQDILFRLDRSGAELKAESKMMAMPIATHFILDRPFLIYMSKRGAKTPYFAMWVDNAELLAKWTE